MVLVVLFVITGIIGLIGWSILVPYLRRHPLLQQFTTDTPQFLLILFIPTHTHTHVMSHMFINSKRISYTVYMGCRG